MINEGRYDNIIIGAGLYGLYAALKLGKLGHHVLVMEYDPKPFMRATYINQARVHMGYHYPRSLTTAIKSAGYFNRFVEDYGFCIHKDFKQIYATSGEFSYTNAEQFRSFCKACGIVCEEEPVRKYFKSGTCDGAFATREYTYDAKMLGDYLVDELKTMSGVEMLFNVRLRNIEKGDATYRVNLENGKTYETDFVINATYAGVNQVLSVTEGLENKLFPIKYELCEIILCEVSDSLKNVGITVMDGPFFSIMPFGKTGLHSLTAVAFTPHITSRSELPSFSCQAHEHDDEFACSFRAFDNCNTCKYKPNTSWDYMSHLAQKYMLPEYEFSYKESLFSQKPILKSSEVDDSRPTMIVLNEDKGDTVKSGGPKFLSVLSGKINTVYDLDEYLV